MGARDGLYQLTGMIELDDGFFSTDKKEEDKDQPQKRGRGSQKKSKVLVMAESEPVEGKTTPKGRVRKVGHIKMYRQMPGLNRITPPLIPDCRKW